MKRMSFQVFGTPVSRGIAIGRAVLVASSRVDVAHYFIDEARIGAEIERLRVARDHVADALHPEAVSGASDGRRRGCQRVGGIASRGPIRA